MQCYAGHYVDNTCFLISRRRASAVPAFFLRVFGSPISRLGLFSSLDPPRRVAPFRDAASRPNLPFLLVLYLSFPLSFSSFLSSLFFPFFFPFSLSFNLSSPLSSLFLSFLLPLSLFLAQPPFSFSARSRDIAVYDGTMCPCFQAPRGLLSLTSSDEGDVLRCARSSLRFFFFFLQLRPPQRTPRFLAEATVPATFVVHHATSSSPARSSRATEKPMLASTAAPWQHPLRSYHVRRRPVTHDRVRFIH